MSPLQNSKPCKHIEHRKNCSVCNKAHSDPRYAALWGVSNTNTNASKVGPCIYLGEESGEAVSCQTCRGSVKVKLFNCAKHGKCTLGKKLPDHACCQGCPDKSTVPGVTVPRLVARFDEHNLMPGTAGKRFNPSIAPDKDGYILAYRDGWAGSNIWVVRLDRDFKPREEATRLELKHVDAVYGREDPRLFWLGHSLHLNFVGVMSKPQLHTNVLFARLGYHRNGSGSFKVEDVFHPAIAGRNEWEKNHAYFEHENNLYAIYSTAPHQVMQVWGNKTEFRWRTPWSVPGWHTELRGGSSPVRVGDEYWSFFHSRYEGRVRTYTTGLYTFEARPPFRPRRIIPAPIDTADPGTKPGDQYAAVVFVGGAVRHNQDWVLATGIHDRFSELRAFPHQWLESRLVPIELREWDYMHSGSGI